MFKFHGKNKKTVKFAIKRKEVVFIFHTSQSSQANRKRFGVSELLHPYRIILLTTKPYSETLTSETSNGNPTRELIRATNANGFHELMTEEQLEIPSRTATSSHVLNAPQCNYMENHNIMRIKSMNMMQGSKIKWER